MEDSMLWNANVIWHIDHLLELQLVNYHIIVTLPYTNNALVPVCLSSQGTLNHWIHVASMFALIWVGCCTMYQVIATKMWRSLTAVSVECRSKWTLTAAAQNGNVHVSHFSLFWILFQSWIMCIIESVYTDEAIHVRLINFIYHENYSH